MGQDHKRGQMSKMPSEDQDDNNAEVEILYMRLKALQSMKEKLDQEEDEDQDEMVVEMEELLQEADQAANEVEKKLPEQENASSLPPEIDQMMAEESVGDENQNESMLSVVKRLKLAAKKTRLQSPDDEWDDYVPASENRNQNDLNYSPTQSPIRDEEFEVIDIDTIRAQSPEAVTIVETTRAEVEFFKQQFKIKEEQEEYFKDQRTSHENEEQPPLFPSSVWGFEPPPPLPPDTEAEKPPQPVEETAEEALESFHKAVMSENEKFRRKRKRNRVSSENEEEKMLRAAVLSSMAVKRTQKEEVLAKQKQLEEIEKQKRLEEEELEKAKKAKIERDLKSFKEEEKIYSDKSVKNKIEKLPIIRKHFPNLILRRVLIPAKELAFEFKIQAQKKPENSKNSEQFMQNLDSFMKDLRSKSTASKKKPPPKPARKFPPPAAKAPGKAAKSNHSKAQIPSKKTELLTSADKESLKKLSNISHLPLDKQAEYKKLLTLLAQKEKTQKKVVKNGIKSSQVNNPDLVSAKIQPVEAKTQPTHGKTQPVEAKTQPVEAKTLPIEAKIQPEKIPTIDSGEIQLSRTKPRPPPPPQISKINSVKADKSTLSLKEGELLQVRKDMAASLFKLSAEVSQLNEETNKKATAEAFLEKLKQQMTDTEKLIAKKNERISKLKSVVSQSRQDILAKSTSLSLLKKECKTLGMKVKGQSYQPPQEGMDTIRKKLNVINNSAKKVTTNDTKSESGSDSSSSSDDDSDSNSDSDESDSESESEDVKGKNNAKNGSLAHLSKNSVVLDPQVEFCRFDLQGKCNDSNCPYQHHRPT